MKLSLPFFNRKRYILLKCYHNNSYFPEYAPITLSSRLDPIQRGDVDPTHRPFRTCYANVAGLNKSAVLPMWSALMLEVHEDGGLSYNPADKNPANINLNFDHIQDPTYDHSQCFVTKISNNWRLQEDSGVDFIMCNHIRNTTQMRIPTGVTNFKFQHSLNVFNLVSKIPHRYTIPFKTPIVALYPLSDLPLQVESEYNVAKFEELEHKSAAKSHFTSNVLKLKRDYT